LAHAENTTPSARDSGTELAKRSATAGSRFASVTISMLSKRFRFLLRGEAVIAAIAASASCATHVSIAERTVRCCSSPARESAKCRDAAGSISAQRPARSGSSTSRSLPLSRCASAATAEICSGSIFSSIEKSACCRRIKVGSCSARSTASSAVFLSSAVGCGSSRPTIGVALPEKVSGSSNSGAAALGRTTFATTTAGREVLRPKPAANPPISANAATSCNLCCVFIGWRTVPLHGVSDRRRQCFHQTPRI
jgi:hypothetical protein